MCRNILVYSIPQVFKTTTIALMRFTIRHDTSMYVGTVSQTTNDYPTSKVI